MATLQGAARRAFRAGRALTYTRVLPHLVDARFVLDGREYGYVWHPAEETWRSERAVEIAIGLAALAAADPRRTLEVGYVLPKYASPPSAHTVVDRYEHAPGVVNADALTFSGGPYDLIVSISTLEHIGYDEEPRDAGKAARAIENLRGLLTPEGELLATIPVGYNRDLDDALREDGLPAKASRTWPASASCAGSRSAPTARGMSTAGPGGGRMLCTAGRGRARTCLPSCAGDRPRAPVSSVYRQDAEPGVSRSLPRGSKTPAAGLLVQPRR